MNRSRIPAVGAAPGVLHAIMPISSSFVVRPPGEADRRRRRLALAAVVAAATLTLLRAGAAPGEFPVRLTAVRGEVGAFTSLVPPTAPETPQATASEPTPASPTTPAIPLTAKGGMRQPVDGGVLTSSFGSRWGRAHEGVDVSADTGLPIRSVGPGTVVAAEPYFGYGLRTIIDHGGGLQTVYAHQSQLLIGAGSAVQAGDVIGLVGCTGSCTGPHLHFEVRQDGVAVDPLRFLV